MQKRHTIILFGGSFDPIHNGHLAVAADAFARVEAERLTFIPARRSPHKTDAPTVDGAHRLAMIELAIAGNDRFSASDIELHRPEPSYTLDTVRHFRALYGDTADLCWLVGADAVAELPRWHRIDELLRVCRLCIMYRGGMDRPDVGQLAGVLDPAHVAQLQNDIVPTPLIDVSSTDIRARIAAGQPVDDMIPPAVLAYIHTHRLYRSPDSQRQ